MSNRNRQDIPNISNSLIIIAFLFAPPIGVILFGVKFLLPWITSFISNNDFRRTNRYSGYERKFDDTVYTDFREKKENGNENTSKTRSKTAERRQSANRSEKKRIPHEKSSTVWMIIGAVFLLCGLLALIPEAVTFGSGLPSTDGFAGALMSMGIGGVSGAIGLSLKRKVKLVKKYVAVIGERGFVSISELASSLLRSKKRVQKELQQVIDSGVFGEYAYIDMGRQIFLRNASFAPAEEEKEESKARADDKSDMNEYERTLRKIRQLNDDIEDVPVSERIYKIEDYTGRIFDYLKKNPEREKDVHTFMTYYLPTTLKLLESYSEIERVGVAGDNMRSAKENIEKTLDLLVEAYKRLLDQLYASESMDISSDIDVLEKMMYKDGLAGNGFTMER